MSASFEEASERIIMVEKQKGDLEKKIQSQHSDLEELKHTNSQLQNKLDCVNRRNSDLLPSFQTHHSLFNEIEMSSQSSNECDNQSINGLNGNQFISDDEIDCDDQELSFSSWKVSQLSFQFSLSFCACKKRTQVMLI
jgi:hypothetical protein